MEEKQLENINYRELLKKYMYAVMDSEGISYVANYPEHNTAEFVELMKIEDELINIFGFAPTK